MRIDKYCWAVRIFKTRSIANKHCSGSKVKLNEKHIKASKELKINDTLSIKNGPIWQVYEVTGFPKSRVGAPLVNQYLKEVTKAEDIAILEEFHAHQKQLNQLGIKGRPTKLDRRKLKKFKS